MDRRYAVLRSAPLIGSEPSPAQAPIPKRRRLGVNVACNACRRRKIRCDGQRPVCVNCIGSNSECTYRDESELSQESRKLVIEIIQILSSLPTEKTVRALQLLSSETSAPVIMSTLRDTLTGRDMPNSSLGRAEILPVLPESVEFAIQNPIAYPRLTLAKSNEWPQIGQSTSGVTEAAGNESAQSGPYDQTVASGQPPLSDSEYDAVHDMLEQPVSPLSKVPAHGSDGGSSELCDPRLQELDIRYWTGVQVQNDIAAKCISLYFETDHPLLANFDPDLFISDLTTKRHEYCSRLLVNALLYWACQMYSSIDPHVGNLALEFCSEAEKLWRIERSNSRDTAMTLAAAEFLGLGYLGQGRDHALLSYISEASQMGQRMGLFGVEDVKDVGGNKDIVKVAEDATRARMYAAWGTFNWITLMSVFYRQPGIHCTTHPPPMQIPLCTAAPSSEYMGATFPQVCRFWTILHEASIVYSGDAAASWGSRATLSFAEYKFRELLAWCNKLPSRLTPGHDRIHHVQVLHLWFHAAILDTFRPFFKEAEGDLQLRTFTSKHTTPNAVCAASVVQLKHLIADYRLNYQSSYSILWHTALIYVINAILSGEKVQNWYSDLLLCIYGYESLNRSWRVAASIAKSLLSLAMKKSNLLSRTASRILRDIENDRADQTSNQMLGEVRATFMADLDLAISEPESATVEHLASEFEDTMLLKDLTFVWENNQ